MTNAVSTQTIIDHYNTGLSSLETARLLNITKRLVLLRLRKAGYERRSLSTALRKYSINEDYFNTIDSEQKAYWLGFILADGNIGKTGRYGKAYQFRCTLQRRDKQHLKLLQTQLNSQHDVLDTIATNRKTMKRYPASFFRFTSKRLCENLVDLGWNGFKQNGNTTILDNIPNKLKPHAVRGLIDGDGWICKLPDRTTIGYCDLFETVVCWVKAYLNNGGSRVRTSRNNKSYRTQYSGRKQVLAVLKLLYENATVALHRKQELANSALLYLPKPLLDNR